MFVLVPLFRLARPDNQQMAVQIVLGLCTLSGWQLVISDAARTCSSKPKSCSERAPATVELPFAQQPLK